MLPVYQTAKPSLEGYETVQVPKPRLYPEYRPQQTSDQVRINIHPSEMC